MGEMESLDKILECFSRALIDDSVLEECQRLTEEHDQKFGKADDSANVLSLMSYEEDSY